MGVSSSLRGERCYLSAWLYPRIERDEVLREGRGLARHVRLVRQGSKPGEGS